MQEAKQSVRGPKRAEFFNGCPRQYDTLLDLIDKLSFESQPPYDELQKLLLEVCH